MKLSFHGAAQQVTGSCHLLECAGHRILIDCGLFQGDHYMSEANLAPFGFDPAGISLNRPVPDDIQKTTCSCLWSCRSTPWLYAVHPATASMLRISLETAAW